jgi:long-chain fatty acid transport protein
MFRKALLVVLCVAVSAITSVQEAGAGGIILYEIGTPDVGRASAGWSARADDPATLFKNPAGMSRLPGSNLQVGVQAMYGQFGFKPDENTMVDGNDGGNAVGWVPGASIFYTHELPSGWNLGIGAFSYFGLATKYDEGWVGRYYVQESGLIGFSLMPAVSYRVSEQLSFGAGLNLMFGWFKQEAAVRNVVGQSDGMYSLDENTEGFGADVGMLWEPADETRVGVTYLSPVKLNFKGTPEFTGLGPVMELALTNMGVIGTEIDLGVTVPQLLMGSIYHELSDDWAVMGNIGWQNWNRFGRIEVTAGDTLGSTTADLQFKDTWNAALGAEWKAAPAWLVTAGIAYDSSPVEDEDRKLQMPMGEMWRFGAGGEWKVSEPVQIGFAYQFGLMGDLLVDQSREFGNQDLRRVSGAYDNAAIHTLMLNLTWKI